MVGRKIIDNCDMAWIKKSTRNANTSLIVDNSNFQSRFNDDGLDVTLNYQVNAAFIRQLLFITPANSCDATRHI
jgi:hypothetical protein